MMVDTFYIHNFGHMVSDVGHILHTQLYHCEKATRFTFIILSI